MPSWWRQWAERIARALVEWWLRPSAGGARGPNWSAEPDPDAPPGPAQSGREEEPH